TTLGASIVEKGRRLCPRPIQRVAEASDILSRHRAPSDAWKGIAMSVERVETLVIGGGQSGLASRPHVIRPGGARLGREKGEVAQRWHSERWDSLHFQSPNWNMCLPGWPRLVADPHVDPHAFSPLCEVKDYLERYAIAIRAPVRTRSAVQSLVRKPGAD